MILDGALSLLPLMVAHVPFICLLVYNIHYACKHQELVLELTIIDLLMMK